MSSSATLLVVDDNEAHRYYVCRTLDAVGFHCVAAGTGNEALTHAQDHPDLVLLDVHLPDMSGFEVCRKLKSDPATAKIPIVMFSAISQDGSVVNDAMQLGVISFLFFPMSEQHLIAVASGALSRSTKKTEGSTTASS